MVTLENAPTIGSSIGSAKKGSLYVRCNSVHSPSCGDHSIRSRSGRGRGGTCLDFQCRGGMCRKQLSSGKRLHVRHNVVVSLVRKPLLGNRRPHLRMGFRKLLRRRQHRRLRRPLVRRLHPRERLWHEPREDLLPLDVQRPEHGLLDAECKHRWRASHGERSRQGVAISAPAPNRCRGRFDFIQLWTPK
jgi:hypothetical protein